MTPEELKKRWTRLIARCQDDSAPVKAPKSGRRIGVHPPWLSSFEAFEADVGYPPDDGKRYGLYRQDTEADYTPENCRWEDHDARDEKRLRGRLTEEDIRNFLWLVLDTGERPVDAGRAYRLSAHDAREIALGRKYQVSGVDYPETPPAHWSRKVKVPRAPKVSDAQIRDILRLVHTDRQLPSKVAKMFNVTGRFVEMVARGHRRKVQGYPYPSMTEPFGDRPVKPLPVETRKPGRNVKIPDEQILQVLWAVHEEGRPPAEVAEKYGVSVSLIDAIARGQTRRVEGYPYPEKRPRPPMSRAKAHEMLYEAYGDNPRPAAQIAEKYGCSMAYYYDVVFGREHRIVGFTYITPEGDQVEVPEATARAVLSELNRQGCGWEARARIAKTYKVPRSFVSDVARGKALSSVVAGGPESTAVYILKTLRPLTLMKTEQLVRQAVRRLPEPPRGKPDGRHAAVTRTLKRLEDEGLLAQDDYGCTVLCLPPAETRVSEKPRSAARKGTPATILRLLENEHGMWEGDLILQVIETLPEPPAGRRDQRKTTVTRALRALVEEGLVEYSGINVYLATSGEDMC